MSKLRRIVVALLLAAGVLLPCTGCSLEMRDAILAGVFDFVSGTVTDSLTSLLPISSLFETTQE